MLYLAAFNWGWLVMAALCGFAMGWVSVIQRSLALADPAMKRCAAVLVALIIISLLRVVPGRAGYWLDLGLVMFAMYLSGCAAGAWLRALVVSRLAPRA